MYHTIAVKTTNNKLYKAIELIDSIYHLDYN